MSTELATRLPELAKAITREHELAAGGYRTALHHAVRVGELLSEAKAQLAHGEWLPWLSEHTPISARNAQQYMQLAGSPNAKALSHLGIEDALHSIAKPTAKPPSADLNTALRGVDQDDAAAALKELGPVSSEGRFPSPGMQRTTWQQINMTLGRVARSMDEGSADGLSKWSRREALHEAARHARSAAVQLSELADTLA